MSQKRRQPLGVQISAIQQARRLLESNMKLVRGLSTLADRNYVLEGLEAAQQSLEWCRDNEALIRAAHSAANQAKAREVTEL